MNDVVSCSAGRNGEVTSDADGKFLGFQGRKFVRKQRKENKLEIREFDIINSLN